MFGILASHDHKMKSKNLSVICTNVQESDESLFEIRRKDVLENWSLLCSKMMLPPIIPTLIIRLTRHVNSPHQDQPRLLKVTLQSREDMENVLLESYRLRTESDSICRIYPDVPWWERKAISNKRDKLSSRNIVLLGVPENDSFSVSETHLHDYKQWRYICDAISDHKSVVVDTFSIPKSPNYKGNGPNLLKITFLTSDMADAFRINWRANNKLTPNDVRPSCPKPTSVSSEADKQPDILPEAFTQQLESETAAKNDNGPIRLESDQ